MVRRLHGPCDTTRPGLPSTRGDAPVEEKGRSKEITRFSRSCNSSWLPRGARRESALRRRLRCQPGHMDHKDLEGWYTDPYGRHEARWLSQGNPTRLVRDGDVEGSDPVEDEPFKVDPVRIEGRVPHDSSDLRRADDAERDPSADPRDVARSLTTDHYAETLLTPFPVAQPGDD